MFCPNCAENLIKDDFNACPYCGTDLRVLNKKNATGYDNVTEFHNEMSNMDSFNAVIRAYRDSFRLRTDGVINIKEYWLGSILHYVATFFFFFSIIYFFRFMTAITDDFSFLIFAYSVIYPIEEVAYLLINLPIIALGIRRMHDVGKSGWYSVIPIYNLILTLTPSKLTDNPYR